MALTGSCSGDPFSVHGHKDSCLVSHPGPEYGFPVNQVILSCNFYIFIASPYQPDLSAPKLFHNHTIVCDTCLITGGNQFPESLKDLILYKTLGGLHLPERLTFGRVNHCIMTVHNFNGILDRHGHNTGLVLFD